MPWCDRCKEYMIWPESHTCPPTWLVWCPEMDSSRDDAKEIRASDAENAAKRWARDFDSNGDYDIVRGAEYVVHVGTLDEDEKVQKFTVRGETVPEYYAEAVDDDDADANDG